MQDQTERLERHRTEDHRQHERVHLRVLDGERERLVEHRIGDVEIFEPAGRRRYRKQMRAVFLEEMANTVP